MLKNSINSIAGVDEAGRGALAGPVVASIVILSDTSPLAELKDSKQLNHQKRKEIYNKLIATTPYIRTAIISNKVIDKINILKATMKAMSHCIIKLPIKPETIYIDGNKTPHLENYNLKAVVQGDKLIPEISAASIIAKVTRDKIMEKYHNKYPEYEFDKHKGYGTEKHFNIIFNKGKSPIHRLTFNVQKQLQLF